MLNFSSEKAAFRFYVWADFQKMRRASQVSEDEDLLEKG